MVHPSIEPLELKSALDSGRHVIFIDVRQTDEHDLVNLEGSTLIPLQELSSSLEQVKDLLATHHDLAVVYCRSGVRSAHAIELLEGAGLRGLLNLRGGLLAYSAEADPSLPTY